MQPVQQAPAAQAPPAQEVPVGWSTPSMQTGLPVAQDTTPTLHGLGLPLQPAPALQATHEPPIHVPPGQVVPSPTLPDSLHTPEPEPQLMLPVLHGFAGLQLAPGLQGLHEPALQTPPGHAVPLILFDPFTHTPLPELQSMAPF